VLSAFCVGREVRLAGICGYKRVSPGPVRVDDRRVNRDVARGGSQQVPIYRTFMEHAGIEPATSGLQIPVARCRHCRGWSSITGISRDFVRPRRGD
jgi:hypothetical protein